MSWRGLVSCPCVTAWAKRLGTLSGVLLCACTYGPPAPIDTRTASPLDPGAAAAPDRVYRVMRGDTLYAIAIGYGLNYLDLAAWNGIAPPYIIQPGRQLRLMAPAAPPAKFNAAPPAAAGLPQGRAISPPLDVSSQRSMQSLPQQRTKPAGNVGGARISAWQWPTAGMPSGVGRQRRGAAAKRGLDISGRSGQDVLAAASGEVVHSGPLKHYGKLIILRHRGEYLSVYGYNSELLVKEGEQVRARQLIARMGLSPAGAPMLHFEIILPDGEAADPRKYLPLQEDPWAGNRG